MAGLGCIDIGGAPARRRDSGERQRRTDARPSRLVGDPRVAITAGHQPQGIASAIIVTHSYMAMKNPAPTPSTNSAYRVSGIITPVA